MKVRMNLLRMLSNMLNCDQSANVTGSTYSADIYQLRCFYEI